MKRTLVKPFSPDLKCEKPNGFTDKKYEKNDKNLCVNKKEKKKTSNK